MKTRRILIGALALALVAATVIACSKEKTTQEETPKPQQQTANPNGLTLAEMKEAISWEEGKAFFENQPISCNIKVFKFIRKVDVFCCIIYIF